MTSEDIESMAAQSVAIDSAKSKSDEFVLARNNFVAYADAAEAERIRKDEISFAVNKT
ncbi:MAG: hypothetical protein K6G15_02760 [Desulfovibrio sp.]|nr:hypothetical protein [Desulfovibrio sp.]